MNELSGRLHSMGASRGQSRRILCTRLLPLAMLLMPSLHAAQLDIAGPVGSVDFGTSVTILPNGNIVVTDPNASIPQANAGAVHLYSPTGALISTLRGGSINDRIGIGGVTVLSNGNYVIRSRFWSNAGQAGAGAVTWGHRDTGVSGTVSPANSLVGSTALDDVGNYRIAVLGNGNFAVRHPTWDNGNIVDAGAVTWANGATGVTGAISSINSVLGTSFEDVVGSGSNGLVVVGGRNFVITSEFWDNGDLLDSGAVTWVDGDLGLTGTITSANSLVGSRSNDLIGSPGVRALANGNYVVSSSGWSDGLVPSAGAVTWGGGSAGVSGAVSAANSLVGSSAEDFVGSGNITPLDNGHYVVTSPLWDGPSAPDIGAVTWADGTMATAQAVAASNSLTGSSPTDFVGTGFVWPIANGNYVVVSRHWHNGSTARVGAATFLPGNASFAGVVATTNSLFGSSDDDFREARVLGLGNGNYVVGTPYWDNGSIADAGAATWRAGSPGNGGLIAQERSLVGSQFLTGLGLTLFEVGDSNYVLPVSGWSNAGAEFVGAVVWADGDIGVSGQVTTSNALVGTRANDSVSSGGIKVLGNGNYLVLSPGWDNASVLDVGAATFVDGNTGLVGAVSPINSLVGASSGDQLGWTVPFSGGGAWALAGGNYAVSTYSWDDGNIPDLGAMTWADGDVGITGPVARSNSMTGSRTGDFFGDRGITSYSSGDYVIRSPRWDNGNVDGAGAITLAHSDVPLAGEVDPASSVLGSIAGEGVRMLFDFLPARGLLVVGRPASNFVSVLVAPPSTLFANGFE